MNFALLRNGTKNALPLPDPSASGANESFPVKTTGDLLAILEKDPRGPSR
jgi:hypothetical protein